MSEARKAINLPLGSQGILRDERIGSEQQAVMLDGLANQHPVERIAMQCGELMEMKYCAFFEWQHRDSMLLPLLQDKSIERRRQRQLSEGMCDRELPYRHHTEQDFIGRIGEHLRGCRETIPSHPQ